MAVQNNVNAALGTVATIAALGAHVNEQAKANEVAMIGAQKELMNASDALAKSDVEITNEMQREVSPTSDLYKKENPVEAYLDEKRDVAVDKLNKAEAEFEGRQFNYEMGNQKAKPSSKRLEKAQEALQNLDDERIARENLKFDVKTAKEKLAAYGPKGKKIVSNWEKTVGNKIGGKQ